MGFHFQRIVLADGCGEMNPALLQPPAPIECARIADQRRHAQHSRKPDEIAVTQRRDLARVAHEYQDRPGRGNPLAISLHRPQFEGKAQSLRISFAGGCVALARVGDDHALQIGALVAKIDHARDFDRGRNRCGLAIPGHPQHENRREQCDPGQWRSPQEKEENEATSRRHEQGR